MAGNSDKTIVAPIVLGFTPINRPPALLSEHSPAQVDSKVHPNEPPRKRRKKERLENPPSPPKTIKTKKRKIPNTKARKLNQPAISPTAEEPGILSEQTKSRLNALRYGTFSTPASNAESCQSGKENQRSGSLVEAEAFKSHSDPNEGSDSTLSSDLWKNQQPLPDYPWLYGLHPKPIDTEERSTTVSDRQSEGSASLEQFLQPDTEVHNLRADDDMISDGELEKLLDGMNADGRDNTARREPECDVVRNSLKICDIPDKYAQKFDDDFPMDEEDLEILCESTCLADPPTKAVADTTKKAFVQDTILQPQLQAPASRNPNCHLQPSAEAVTASDYLEENEVDGLEFEEMIDLLEALPETPKRSVVASRNDLDRYSLDETLVPSPAASMHTIQESPLKSTQLQQDAHSRFVRPPHPSALQTPSPIHGLSSEDRVLTCFRIGEAVNATAKAQRQGRKVLVELYARVLHSIRAGPVQTFRIVDLWSSPDKHGIVLEGRWVGWEKSELWKKDGEIFWEESLQVVGHPPNYREKSYARECRLIGSLERNASGGYLVNILNLWEATWDDVEFAKGLVFEPSEAEEPNR